MRICLPAYLAPCLPVFLLSCLPRYPPLRQLAAGDMMVELATQMSKYVEWKNKANEQPYEKQEVPPVDLHIYSGHYITIMPGTEENHITL